MNHFQSAALASVHTSHPLVCLCTSTGIDGFVSVHEALKAYYGASIVIIGCDMRPDAYGLYLADKGYVIPKLDAPDFTDTLAHPAIDGGYRDGCRMLEMDSDA